MTLQQRIRAAQRENERALLRVIKSAATSWRGSFWPGRMRTAWWNALERLEAKGRVRYSRAKMGYVVTRKGATR